MANTSSPFYMECHGLKASPISSPDAVHSAINYVHKPGQIFVVAYPKSGSTWLQYIVILILKKGEPFKDEMEFLQNAPVLEVGGAGAVDMMKGPGVIKMHLPYNFVNPSKKAKYIYLARNPRECCVSLYYHTRNSPFYNFHHGSFDEFFDLFINGKTDFGDFFDYLFSWYEHKDDPNVHFLTFEGLKKDTKNEVLKLAKFLGDEYYNVVSSDTKILENIVRHSGPECMKTKVTVDEIPKIPAMPIAPGFCSNVDNSEKIPPEDASEAKFVRKEFTDWMDLFTPDKETKMEEWIKRKTEGSDVMNLWKEVTA